MTDHIGDSTQMVPMTQERLDEIRERMETMVRVFPENSYAVLPTLINKDIPDLLQEIKRLRAYIRTRETAQVTHYCENCEANAQAKQAAEAEVERLRAERDEAIGSLESLMAIHSTGSACDMCGNYNPKKRCTDCWPVWIGRKEG